MDAAELPRDLDVTAIWAWGAAFLPGLALALVILGVGALFARWACRIVSTLLTRAGHVDETIRPVIVAVVRYAIMILVIILALGQVGVQTASLLAVLGAAGLAIGLALQGTLTNIAAGIMLLWLRPFRIGDYIEVQGGGNVSGIVKEMGLFACELETFDGIAVFAPNSTIWNHALRNHTRNAGRLISLSVEVASDAEIERARAVLTRLLQDDRRVLDDPPPNVFAEKQASGKVQLTCRVWAAQSEVGPLQRSIVEAVKRALEDTGDGELKPQMIVRTVPPDADPSRLINFERRARESKRQ